MLKKLASDALGLSDIGTIVTPDKYNMVDADDYIMHEDGEKIFFLIKSRTDEYCFTNLAFIHVDGTSAVSKKRTVKRYEYYKHAVSNVLIETAGTIDLDCELKFTLGDVAYSIDVNKNQIEGLKDIYKSLIKIGQINEENHHLLQKSEKSLELAVSACGSMRHEQADVAQVFAQINEYSFNWMEQSKKAYAKKDFSDVFKNYMSK
ncbi:MAG TPA: hypothetical protein DCY20_10705 [Firmicutes bacterium]|nr:hypothetical protein [Bacillota bacterium]